jgi:hypothetical protein
MRVVSALVLPEPAPATMSSGPPSCVTALRCCGFSPSSSRSADTRDGRGGASASTAGP